MFCSTTEYMYCDSGFGKINNKKPKHSEKINNGFSKCEPRYTHGVRIRIYIYIHIHLPGSAKNLKGSYISLVKS